MTFELFIQYAGAGAFGAVIGWITGEILKRSKKIGVSHLGGIVGVVGGAAVTSLFKVGGMFGTYCIGMAVFFFFNVLLKDPEIKELREEEENDA